MLNYNVLNEYVEKLKKNELTIVSTTNNIKALTTADINKLKAGDIVLKEDESGKHAYVVSYKKNGTGICLTYTDATYAETISYDYNSVTKEWVYNSMDSIEFVSKSYVDSLMSGALKREIVETLPLEDIDNNTIYMVLDSESTAQSNVYNEYMYINNSWELIGSTATSGEPKYVHNITATIANYKVNISFTIINNSNTKLTATDVNNYIKTYGNRNTQDAISCSCIYADTSTSAPIIVTKLVYDNTWNQIQLHGIRIGINFTNSQWSITDYSTNTVIADWSINDSVVPF